MAGSFGIGLGSFLKGVADGANAYSGIQTAKSQQKLNDMRVKEAESNLAEKTAAQDRQADANRIGKIGLEEGQALYGNDVKKVIDHYNNNIIPKQQQFWIENGDVEKADTLGKFMKTKQAEQLTGASALAIKQASMGDYTNLGPTIESLLDVSAQVTGGGNYKFKSVTPMTDDKGVKTGGVSFKFTDPNGKDQDISFNNTGELVGFIRNNSMPDKIVEYAYDQEQQARKVRAETASNNQKWKQKIAEKGLDFKYNVYRDNNLSSLRSEEARKISGLRIQEQTNQAQLDNAYGGGSGGSNRVAEAEATIQFLRENGVPEEYIQANLTSIAGLENKQRPMSSRIDDYIKMRSGADLKFGQLSTEQQVSEAKKYIAAVDEQSGGSEGTADNPFPANNSQGKGLTPYYDSRTNQVVYR